MTLFKMAKAGDVRAAEVLSTRIWPTVTSSKLEAAVETQTQEAAELAKTQGAREQAHGRRAPGA